ncbi:bifunctional DNA primase/polymerase [Saccharothrix australiensis]|uniref:Bifunctional DNA primase/polymerase-like protein n=1 Tax=Saccharothrix australiensis TaxID=2072 RepID=A0A495VUK8_9PSEU|nr:bifunctional DNA primase/polymerase [Saccharothrix australiensis]RKT53022.1 bifunctional DNA primase/polymerase-like protein [Saccharothrix australiensis]
MSGGFLFALECAERGWPVIPGASWLDGAYVDPVLGHERDALSLCPPDMATTDEDLVRRWWPVLASRLERSVLVVTQPNLVAVVVEADRARRVVGSEAFRANPTPAVLVATWDREEEAMFLLSSSRGLAGESVAPVSATIPMPSAVVEGRPVRWLWPMTECESLMAGEQLALLLK